MASPRYRSGPFIIDPNTAEITRDGIPLKLRPQAFHAFTAMADRIVGESLEFPG